MDRDYVERKLLETGMPSNLLGFDYIIDYIMLTERDDWKNVKITAIYAKIAKMQNTSLLSVEGAIRYAFENGKKVIGVERFKYYFGYSRANNQAIDHFKRVIKRDFPKYVGEKCENVMQQADDTYENALNALNLLNEKLMRIGDILSRGDLLLEQ